jgi:hypothetical protein
MNYSITCLSFFNIEMPRQKISTDVQWIIIRLQSLLRKEDISAYTGVSLRSIERILKYFNTHRTVKVPELEKRRYQSTHLRDLDVEVSGVVEHKHLFIAYDNCSLYLEPCDEHLTCTLMNCTRLLPYHVE